MIAAALSSILPGRRATDYGPLSDFWYAPLGSVSSAGIAVKPENAMAVSAVYGCVRLLRESLGSLPFRVYRRTGERSKEPAPDHFLWQVLHDRPNSWQTPMEFREMGVSHLCLRGNFYCEIFGWGEKTQLIPLNPDRMKVEQNPGGKLKYTYRVQSGEPRVYSQENIFHVRGMSLNGVVGVSVLEYARHAVGLAIAQETHGASLFKNGGLPTFWISRPAERKWTPDAQKNFRTGWRALHAGAENAGNPPILQDDMAIHELGLSNRDSQWIEARGFGAEEICRFFGISPHMVGVKTVAPLGSIEQQSLEYVIYTLTPLAARWEQAANRDLVDDRETYYTKIVLDGLLRGDMKSRYEAHNISVQGGWGLVNEARELEDRDPIEGGDTPRYPANMQPAGGGPDQNEQGGQPGKGTPKPKQQPAAEDEEPTAYEKRKQKKKAAQAAFGVLLDEAAARIAAAEIHSLGLRAGKAADDRAKWGKWAADFYQKHRGYVAKTLDPIAAAWHEATEEKLPADELASDLCSLVGPVFDADTDVPILLETWKTTRAGELARQLKARFFDD